MPRSRRGLQGLGFGLVSLLVLSLAWVGTGAAAPTGASGAASATSTATALPAATPLAHAGPVHTAIAPASLRMLQARVASMEQDPALPKADLLLPNLGYADVREGSALVPSNLAGGSVSPGPTSIGVNDLGLRSTASGTIVPYSYRTTSLDGAVTIDNVSLVPIMMNASESLTLQLNAVLNNVTLFGQPVGQIWAQNVIFYSVAGDQMQLATDAWNFTGYPFALFPNDIYAHSPGGFLFGGTYVHAVPFKPPAFHLRPPFTIHFYLNATNVGGRNALYFNYSLVSAYNITLGPKDLGRSIQDGSFDWIIFNSTAGMPKGYRAPPASFLISGSQPTGLGLPNDAEMAVCGGSDGFSGITRSLNASAQLLYLNGTTGTYQAVPAAWTTTEDTGESMEGVDAHFTAASASEGVAYLTNGPEFVYGLWNATAASVHEVRYQVSATPASALLWVSPRGRSGPAGFNDSLAAWDLTPSPGNAFWLPTGPSERYALEAFANDYTPRAVDVKAGAPVSLALTPNAAEGLYVPVLAFGNSGVAAIAQSGTGTAAHPYVIAYSQYHPILSLFSAYDIFTQPLYPGLLLYGVTAHVIVQAPPSLRIDLSAEAASVLVGIWGLTVPSSNELPIEVYDSSNVSIVHAAEITGWFPVTLTGFLMASLFLSNDTHTLVAYDHFSSMGSAMVIVAPNGNRTRELNTVFGCVFDRNPVTTGPFAGSLLGVLAFNTTYTGPIAPGGLGVFSSGNTIYNNLFRTPITVYSPPQNPYLAYVFVNDFGYTYFSSVAATWPNHWNISLEPASYVGWANGIPLTGSVVGAPFQGGNAYTNWNGSLPYTDGGLLVGGADHLPLPLAHGPRFAVVFEETGLPRGDGWSVSLGGHLAPTDRSLVLVYVRDGTYAFTVSGPAGFLAHPASGSVTVSGSDLVVRVRFT